MHAYLVEFKKKKKIKEEMGAVAAAMKQRNVVVFFFGFVVGLVLVSLRNQCADVGCWLSEGILTLRAVSGEEEADTKAVLTPLPKPILEREAEDDELSIVLREVATYDGTVILTTINEAFASPPGTSLFDLFIESFRIGEDTAHLLNHVLVVSVDEKGHQLCRQAHSRCFLNRLTSNGSAKEYSDEKEYMSKGYIEVVWWKLVLQHRILQLGYNILFTDVDVMWFRDPFKHMMVYPDITLSCDTYFGDPDDMNNNQNTGFYYVKASKKTAEMVKRWLQSKDENPGMEDQAGFSRIKHGLVDGDLKIKMRYLDPTNFGGFCSHGKDLSKIWTMHANCCVGLENKLQDLRSVLDDWKMYLVAMSPTEESQNKLSWTAPGRCIK